MKWTSSGFWLWNGKKDRNYKRKIQLQLFIRLFIGTCCPFLQKLPSEKYALLHSFECRKHKHDLIIGEMRCYSAIQIPVNPFLKPVAGQHLLLEEQFWMYYFGQACPKSDPRAKCGPRPNFDWPAASFIMNRIRPMASILYTIDNTNRLTIICSSHYMWPSWQKLWTPLT